MKNNNRSETDKMYLSGKNGEWVDEFIRLCSESGIDIPIIKTWYKKDPTTGKYITFSVRILRMAEEVLDNNRRIFKSIGDVIRSAIYIGMMVIYRMLIANKNNTTTGSWGKANHMALLHMQEMVQDIQDYVDNVKTMKSYHNQFSEDDLITTDRFQNACKDLILTAPEEKRKSLWKAYDKIVNKEKIVSLHIVGGHGGPREGAGRKAKGDS